VDLGILGQISFSWDFVVSFFSIILINLILSGDNAVIIALAVRSLPRPQRIKGIAFGSSVAVVLRVVLTFFAARLLEIQFVKFFGGAVIIWIAVKLFVEVTDEKEVHKEAKTLWQAIWVILIADITMSLDNVLAVAAASKGNLFLLLFGLGLSIPLVVFTSNLLSKLMDKYPVLIYVGAAILGRVGGEMMISDPFVFGRLHPSPIVQYCVEFFFMVGVLVAGKVWLKWAMVREVPALQPVIPTIPSVYPEGKENLAILTLSREYKNGSVEIGRAVAQQLGYVLVDRFRIYDKLMAVGEKWGRLAHELEEERPSIWEKYDREYLGFIALVESAIYDYAVKGGAVILGRGSAFLLHDVPHVLKVRVYAPMELRIKRMMEEDKVDRLTAERVLTDIDKSRFGYVQAIYGKNYKDVKHYDLIFNTAIQSYEKATKEIVETLEEFNQRVTPEGLQQLKDRALAAKIKALISIHPDIFIPTLAVTHDGRAVVLEGKVHGPKEYRLVEEIARETAGSCPVTNQLVFRR
jgi:YjbE family integral membrane protein